MNSNLYKEICEKFAVKPFEVTVDWYTGDITKETVIADDGINYYFEFNRNKSWYAPHTFIRQ